MTSIGAGVLAGTPDQVIRSRRRVLIGLIGERAYDTGIVRGKEL